MNFPEMFPRPDAPTDAEKLLHEWAKWWHESDEAPAKMPGALHVRTATFFQLRKFMGASTTVDESDPRVK